MAHRHDEPQEANRLDPLDRLDALEGQVKMILAMLKKAGIRPPEEEAKQGHY